MHGMPTVIRVLEAPDAHRGTLAPLMPRGLPTVRPTAIRFLVVIGVDVGCLTLVNAVIFANAVFSLPVHLAAVAAIPLAIATRPEIAPVLLHLLFLMAVLDLDPLPLMAVADVIGGAVVFVALVVVVCGVVASRVSTRPKALW